MSKELTENIISKIAVLDFFPPSIKDTIMSDYNFRKNNDLLCDAVISFENSSASFQRSALFEVIRRAYVEADGFLVVTSKDEKIWKLTVDKISNINCISLECEDHKYILDELWSLNPSISKRLETLEKIAKKCNFSSSTKGQWSSILSSTSVSDDDVTELSKEIARSPISIYKKIKLEMRQGSVQFPTLVPIDEKYYERLVGKHKSSSTIYEYTKLEIDEHINTLFLEDLHSALIFFLLISSHPSISFCIERFIIDSLELEKVYDWLINFGDPFSCIAGIELGLSVIHKHPSLGARIEKLLDKLLGEAIKKEFKLLTSLIILVDGELARLHIFRDKPPFYRRLASIAQASLIVRSAIEADIDFDSLLVEDKGNMRFYCQSFIDCRLEPRWFPDYLTPEQLRAELIGRAYNILEQCRASSTSEILKNILLNSEKNSILKDVGMEAFLPGPLEGNTKPNDSPPAISKIIEKELAKGILTPQILLRVVNSVLYWKVDPYFMELLAKILIDTKYQLSEVKSPDELLTTLNALAKAACIGKNTEMAMSLIILGRKYREYLNINSQPEGLMVIGLIAAASFNDLENWAKYMGDWFNELSYLPLDSDAARRLYGWIKQLCLLEPLLYCTAGLALANLTALTS